MERSFGLGFIFPSLFLFFFFLFFSFHEFLKRKWFVLQSKQNNTIISKFLKKFNIKDSMIIPSSDINVYRMFVFLHKALTPQLPVCSLVIISIFGVRWWIFWVWNICHHDISIIPCNLLIWWRFGVAWYDHYVVTYIFI